MPRKFRSKNLSVSLVPTGRLADITDKLRLCVLHSHICLGWTHCRLFTHYCGGWVSWCHLFTWKGCPRHSLIDDGCIAGTIEPGCPGGSEIFDLGRFEGDPVIYQKQLTELKADLHEAIAQLDAHQREIAEITKARG